MPHTTYRSQAVSSVLSHPRTETPAENAAPPDFLLHWSELILTLLYVQPQETIFETNKSKDQQQTNKYAETGFSFAMSTPTNEEGESSNGRQKNKT